MKTRDLRPVYLAFTVVLLAIAAVEFVLFFQFIDGQKGLGVDLTYYRDISQRWLDTGVWYTERQLAGPYETISLVDNLYPPIALYFFLPWIWLPFPLWWILPIAMVAYAVWRLRPRAWAWPIMAAILVWPKSPVSILYGNSDLLVVAFVAAGVLWSWPGVLILFKPSMGIFAFVGIRRRSWWIGLGVLALVSLPLLSLWVQWPTVVINSSGTLIYSLSNMPLVALPLVAWLASSTRPALRMPSLPGIRQDAPARP